MTGMTDFLNKMTIPKECVIQRLRSNDHNNRQRFDLLRRWLLLQAPTRLHIGDVGIDYNIATNKFTLLGDHPGYMMATIPDTGRAEFEELSEVYDRTKAENPAQFEAELRAMMLDLADAFEEGDVHDYDGSPLHVGDEVTITDDPMFVA